ncbi:hypothetical protein QEJ31_10090 [Pigmentibacter sp. JX0631]|uniref:hypothetical protein n=1 Tax=Pigmentibacter sp. JX0631 TaxID=2976982 RepID=UPI0024689E5E|nr:hypothetical protein [Pigmentibacter sp. JX0631]WGL58871.1 hypothetical protein QEJ31_10090 [Pigmentibacter sp. JX0631]
MIKNIFYSLFLITLILSCGKTEESSDDVKKEQVLVDTEFKYYVENVKEKLRKYSVSENKISKIDDVTIEFGDIHRKNGKEKVAGFCVVKYTKKIVYSQRITIDISQWHSFSSKYKTEIIAHELGHCAWGLKHDHTEDQIMSEILTNITEPKWHIFAEQIIKSSDNIRNI